MCSANDGLRPKHLFFKPFMIRLRAPLCTRTQALSIYFETNPSGVEMGWELLAIFTALWDTADVRNTFTLVMHRWLFAQETDVCKALNVLTKGANSLFWLDLFAIETRFQPLFLFLAERLTDDSEINNTVDGNVYVTLVKLISRFICYYELHSTTHKGVPLELQDLSCFVTQMEQSAWWKRCVGPDSDVSSAASLVVTEIAHQLGHIRSEELIVQFLVRMRSLLAVVPRSLDITARLRLENILHGLSSPGGPLYPPRGVRAHARKVQDELFPQGRHSRQLVHLSFRLLNPYRWPPSLAHWTLVEVPTIVCKWMMEHMPSSCSAAITAGIARCRRVWRCLCGRRGRGVDADKKGNQTSNAAEDSRILR